MFWSILCFISSRGFDMIKRLSPEYFKKVCETIWRHDWKSDFAYRSYFRKFMLIFDVDDVKEFNGMIETFYNKWFHTPMDIEDVLNRMFKSNKTYRIRYRGEKILLRREDILKDLENIIRWCHKKLNEYYKLYGFSIEGIDISDISEMRGFL